MNIKKKFTLISAIITAFPTIWFIPIPYLGGFLYEAPVAFVGYIFYHSQYTFLPPQYESFGLTPNFYGWMILIPFWFIIGYLLGLLVYKIRERASIKKNKPLNLKWAFFSVLMFQDFVGLLFIFFAIIFHVK